MPTFRVACASVAACVLVMAVATAAPAQEERRPNAPADTPVVTDKPARVGPTVLVHIECEQTVELYRRPAQASVWQDECASPCDLDMPIGDEYRITGPRMHRTGDFRLEGTPGNRVVINVGPAWRSTDVIGGVLIGVGAAVDFVGLFAAQVALLSAAIGCDPQFGSCSSGGIGTVAIGLLIAGTGLMATGGIIMITNSSSGVSQAPSRSTPTSARPLDAYKREAMWRTSSAAPQGARPAISVPIFSRSF